MHFVSWYCGPAWILHCSSLRSSTLGAGVMYATSSGGKNNDFSFTSLYKKPQWTILSFEERISRCSMICEARVISWRQFAIALNCSYIFPVQRAAGIDRPTELEGWSFCQLLSGYVTGMAIKHLFSVSLEDGCLTRFQLASLAAPLSTDDKHQYASNANYTKTFFDLMHQ